MQKPETSFYLKWQEPVNATLQALRFLILEFDVNLEETIKYGMQCFTCNGKHKFYLGVDLKKNNEPYVLFVDGNKIDDIRLEAGTRKRMKIYRINPHKDIDKEEFYALLKMALSV
jgi:uncharacterized protein YdhG (YjbR/CyaY superfamily)